METKKNLTELEMCNKIDAQSNVYVCVMLLNKHG